MKIDREAPIGVFDSGVGGLTVAREIMRNLPSEKIPDSAMCVSVTMQAPSLIAAIAFSTAFSEKQRFSA